VVWTSSFLASRISVWFSLLASTPASTRSTRATQKTYKVSTSGPRAFSSRSYSSAPGNRISSPSVLFPCGQQLPN
ncbi:Keratin, type II cytoskeletal 8, partial [Myotis brandtii]